jgi:hypothetical protein
MVMMYIMLEIILKNDGKFIRDAGLSQLTSVLNGNK